MNSVRITKYNPLNRDANGHYTLVEEWTSISDVGKSFYGQTLTMQQYLITEDKYIDAVESLMQETGSTHLRIISLENHFNVKEMNLAEGKTIPRKMVKELVKMILREKVWGKLIAKNQFEIHFGTDYYMYYVGEGITEELIKKLRRIEGLYIEEFRSPYLDQ